MTYSSIRHDHFGVSRRITERGGNISTKEFKASFPVGIELLNRPNADPITIHKGRKSSGEPLVTLVSCKSEDVNPETVSARAVSMTELLYGVELVATMLEKDGVESVPVRKGLSNGELGPVVAYAMRPAGFGFAQAA